MPVDSETIGIWFGIAATIIGGAVSVIGTAVVLSGRLSRAELKLEMLWDLLFKRALSQAVSDGIGKINSPLVLNPDVMSRYEGIAGRLRSFYARVGHQLSELELFREVECQFGDELMNEVALPHSMPFDTCVVGAMAVARSEHEAKPSEQQPIDGADIDKAR